jgi:putative phosphonate metabolism protein
MRVAIYFTPDRDHPLTRHAAAWLGRDAFAADDAATGAGDGRPVSEPARYGFHATLKAPFRLARPHTLAALDVALSAFARSRAGLELGALRLARIDGFFALVPSRSLPGLSELEAEVRTHFEPYRAPLTEADYLRRQPDRLTPRQRDNLIRWGYPHVADDFRFHMTLTDRVPDAAAPAIAAELERALGPALRDAVQLDALALFVEPEPGQPFSVHSRHALGLPATIEA